MVSFEKLASALLAFLENEIIPSMTVAQEIVARMGIAWLIDSGAVAVDYISQIGWAKAFQIVDGNKNINAERALGYLRIMAQKKKLDFTLPILGHFVFGPEDIDKLKSLIEEK